jgi:carbamoyl-phosphate synthase large subunit
VLDLIMRRDVDLVINNATGSRELADNYRIRRAAVEASIACLTSLDTATALVTAFESESGPPRSLQEYQGSRFAAPR